VTKYPSTPVSPAESLRASMPAAPASFAPGRSSCVERISQRRGRADRGPPARRRAGSMGHRPFADLAARSIVRRAMGSDEHGSGKRDALGTDPTLAPEPELGSGDDTLAAPPLASTPTRPRSSVPEGADRWALGRELGRGGSTRWRGSSRSVRRGAGPAAHTCKRITPSPIVTLPPASWSVISPARAARREARERHRRAGFSERRLRRRRLVPLGVLSRRQSAASMRQAAPNVVETTSSSLRRSDLALAQRILDR
jgi:hypothetical protein